MAALPDESLRLGMHPGWVKVEGPVPDGPKVAALRPAAEAGSTEEDGGENPLQKTETAGGTSAKKKE